MKLKSCLNNILCGNYCFNNDIEWRKRALGNFIYEIDNYLISEHDNNINIKLKRIVKFLSIGIQNEINAFCCLHAHTDILDKHTGEIINRSLIPEKISLSERRSFNNKVNIKTDPVLTSL